MYIPSMHLIPISLMFVAYNSRCLSRDASGVSRGDANCVQREPDYYSAFTQHRLALALRFSTLNPIETKFFERLSIIQSIIHSHFNTTTSTSPSTTYNSTTPTQINSNRPNSPARHAKALPSPLLNRNSTTPAKLAAMAERYIPEHRRTQFKAKNTFKPEELRRRREEQQVEIRKAKREENLAKRRGITGGDGARLGASLGAEADSDDDTVPSESQVGGSHTFPISQP
jgi:hypothetical protein